MKNIMKKVIKLAFVAAFVAVAGYGVYANQNTSEISDLALANVDALARGEVIIGQPCVSVLNSACLYYYPWEQWEESGAFYN